MHLRLKIHLVKLEGDVISYPFNKPVVVQHRKGISVNPVAIRGKVGLKGPIPRLKIKPFDVHLLAKDKANRRDAAQLLGQSVGFFLIHVPLGLLLINAIGQQELPSSPGMPSQICKAYASLESANIGIVIVSEPWGQNRCPGTRPASRRLCSWLRLFRCRSQLHLDCNHIILQI